MRIHYTILNPLAQPAVRPGTAKSAVMRALNALDVNGDTITVDAIEQSVPQYLGKPMLRAHVIDALSRWVGCGFLEKHGGSFRSRHRGGSSYAGAPPPSDPSSPPKAPPSRAISEDPTKAAHDALVALHHALLTRYRSESTLPSSDSERAFARVEKVMQLAIRPGTDAEGSVATRMAFRGLIDLVYG